MKITSSAKTDPGKTRKNNEDSFLIDDRMSIYAVADGIGGHQAGEVASKLAAETVHEIIAARLGSQSAQPGNSRQQGSALAEALLLANKKIRESAAQNRTFHGMGTTMTALLIGRETAFLAHIGDSRAYRLRAGSFTQLSEDHSVVAEQVRAGLLAPGQVRLSPYRHIITRALGIHPDLLLDQKKIDIEKNDIFLLCTDGLTEMVDDGEIARILEKFSPDAAVERLIATANDHGGVDNITAVVLKIEELG